MRSLQFLGRNGVTGRKASAVGVGVGVGVGAAKQRREEHSMEHERKRMVENSNYDGRYV